MKLCNKCHNYFWGDCLLAPKGKSLVNGKMEYYSARYTREESEVCGIEGRLFIKANFFERIIKNLLN